MEIHRLPANNSIAYTYVAGGVVKATNLGALTTVYFMWLGITWDISAGVTGEMRAYYGGVQTGATAANLGTWIGNMAADRVNIGVSDNAPVTQPWHGDIGPVAPADLSQVAPINIKSRVVNPARDVVLTTAPDT